MNQTRLHLLLMAVLLAGLCASSQTPAPHAAAVETLTPPVLVDCTPVTTVPCLSASVTAVDALGKPAPVTFPAGQPLNQSLRMTSGDGAEVVPFYASAGAGADAAQHRNVILLMIDISGSMNQPSPGAPSRFLAVKGAIARYLEGMQQGVDEIAIVPFESHNVVSTIRAAVFSSRRADLLAQLNALPAPQPKNNTALFQSVFSGVDSLRTEVDSLERSGSKPGELEPHLVVMTDGTNEVHPGDDALLLDGPLGLEQAAAQVQSSHLDVVGVGFGDRAAIDAAALTRLSTRFLYAADADQLLAALHGTRSALSHVLAVSWLVPESSRIALTGRDQVWTPTMTLEDGTVLHGQPVRLVVPATTAPVFARGAEPAELAALLATHPPASAGWTVFLVHLLLFLAVVALLLVLWFWVPRLVWGAEAALPPTRRWAGSRPTERGGDRAAPPDRAVTVASGVQIRESSVPAGFAAERHLSGPLERSPSQTTQVAPHPDPGRTRLKFE